MRRLLSLVIIIFLVVASISCAAPKQKEIDAIHEFAASTGTELYSVKYNPSSGVIEVVAPMEGINYMLSEYLTGNELSVENWNSLKEVMPEAENYILRQLSGLGYTTPISLSFSDTLSPDIPLLTSQGGKIVYEATEVPVVTASPSLSEGSGTPAANDSLSNDPEGAVSVLKDFLPQMESEYESYTIQYNETAGIIEIINIVDNIASSLATESVQTETGEGSADQISLKEGLIYNWNMFNSMIQDSGYSVPISLSVSDGKVPDQQLLTILDGKIVFDAFSPGSAASFAGAETQSSAGSAEQNGVLIEDPVKAVAVLEEYLKTLEDDSQKYTVTYNETTGIIEVFYVIQGIANIVRQGSIDWDSTKSALLSNCNAFGQTLIENGYAGTISLSLSDSDAPDKPLLTAMNDEIVFDITE
jgi:hypothetical protein